MNRLFIYILFFSLFSCEKICTLTTSFCKDKVEKQEPIDFTQIDLFPLFKKCESKLSFEESKTCFESTLNKQISTKINNLTFSSENSISDTIYINFSISKKGKFKCENVKVTPELETLLPNLTFEIYQIIKELDSVSPAQKRGIPVKSTYTIPLLIETE